MLGGCAATLPRGGVASSRPSAPVPSASSGTNEAVTELSPCEKAAALRSWVPGWLVAGKLHRSLYALEAANHLCSEAPTSIRITELEILVELGRKDAARELAGELSNGPLSPEERAAVDRALALLGAHDEWNRADVFALIDAGRFALKAGKASDAQRLFDRGLEELERRYATTVRVELRRDLSHTGDMVWVPSTEFVAVVDDGDIVLVDGDTLKERLRWKVRSKWTLDDYNTLLAASPDGRWLVSTVEDSLIRRFSVSDGKLLNTIEGPTGSLSALALSPDGKVIASVGSGPGVRLYRAYDGVLLRVLRGTEEPTRVVAFSPDGLLLASGTRDGVVRLVRLANGALVREIKGLGDVTGLTFFTDAGTLLVGTKDGRFCRVKVADGTKTCSPKTGEREISDLAVVGHGPLVAAMTNGSMGLWHGSTGEFRGEIRRSKKATGYVNAAFSPDERLVVLRRDSGGLESLSNSSGDPITPDKPHDWHVQTAYDRSGTTMASGDMDGTVWLWRARDGALLGRLSGHEKDITGLAFDTTGNFLASSSSDGSVRLWKTADGSLVRVFAEPGKPATSVMFAPDGKSLWAGFRFGTLRRWSVPDGRPLDAPDTDKGMTDREMVESIAFNVDGTLVAIGTTHGRIRLWRTGDNSPLCSSDEDTDRFSVVSPLAFTPDGRRVVGNLRSHEVNVWSAGDCQPDGSFSPPEFSSSDSQLRMGENAVLALSRDGTFLATNYGDGSVRLLSTRDGAELHSFKRDHNQVEAVGIAPDDHQLLFATEQGLEVWKLDGTEPVLRFSTNREHDAIVTVSGSGRYFDIVGTGEPWALDNMAVCRIGPVSLPLEVCAERTRVPGLGAKLASNGTARAQFAVTVATGN
jgi:WD40 repeat protein